MRLDSVEGLAGDESGTEKAESVPIAPTPGRLVARASGKVALYAVLVAAAIICISPFLWMVSTSLKAESQLFSFPPEWIPDPVRFSNYVDMAQAFPILRQLFNSVFVTATVSFGQVLFCSLAGYSFARLRFPGRDKLFMIYLGTLMVPFMVTLVPSYALMRYFGWIESAKREDTKLRRLNEAIRLLAEGKLLGLK
jgi:multiple sugar transport system permease protein